MYRNPLSAIRILFALGLLVMAIPMNTALAHQGCSEGYELLNEIAFQRVVDDLCRLELPVPEKHYSTCVETADRAFCIAPGTPKERVEEILRSLPTWTGDEGDRYNRESRWGSTSYGWAGYLGDPITIGYSFVPDGTWIPTEGQSSTLYAEMNSHFPDEATWKALFADILGLWSAKAGLTYVEQPDDGASFPNSTGVIGVRGDVRIACANIDGSSNTLAYNYYPSSGGDMVLDSSENWGNASQNYRFITNVVSHEHGHGLGLGHVIPTNYTKLMEAYYNSNFEGPKEDDIRGGQKNYGDPFEKNDGFDEATEWGTISDGLTILDSGFSIDASNDKDYFRFEMSAHASFDVTLAPVGSYYQVGPEGGSASWIHTDEQHNLSMIVFDENFVTLATVNDTGLGENEVLDDFAMDAGIYYIRVQSAGGTGDVQLYKFWLYNTYDDFTGVGEGDAPLASLGLSAFPNPFNPKTTLRFYASEGPVGLEIFDTLGRKVHSSETLASQDGWMQMDWTGMDNAGESVPSGIYFLRVRSGGMTETVRGVLLK